MDIVKKVIPSVGEAGIDTEASPGNGSYYVRIYDGSYDACGFDTLEEAVAELTDAELMDIAYDWELDRGENFAA